MSLPSVQTALVAKVLASKLGLTKRSKHVQLSYWFSQPLVVDGQLKLSRGSAGKNPAAMLTKHLTASTLHKILPKLGVRTRAADSRDLLSMLSLDLLASSSAVQSSFLIGMMAEQSVPAHLVPSSVASRPFLHSSLPHKAEKQYRPCNLHRELNHRAALDDTCSPWKRCFVQQTMSLTPLSASRRTASL